jgi:hypothetical protein
MILPCNEAPSHPNSPKGWVERWKDIIYLYPLAPVESFMGAIHIAFGLPFILPGINVFSGGRVFRILHDVIPEFVVGTIAIAIGAFMLSAVTSRGRRQRRLAAFLSSVWWGTLVLTFILSAGPHNTAVWTYSVITLASLWLTWRWANPDPTRP